MRNFKYTLHIFIFFTLDFKTYISIRNRSTDFSMIEIFKMKGNGFSAASDLQSEIHKSR